jgi:hypothetical protein
MNILDENIVASQRQLLQDRKIKFRQIGRHIGRSGMDDEEIIPLLHQLNSITFFTQDRDFFYRRFCHPRYCLVHLVVEKDEAAEFIRRVLRHPELNTHAKRMGKVIKATRDRLYVWRLHAQNRQILGWP